GRRAVVAGEGARLRRRDHHDPLLLRLLRHRRPRRGRRRGGTRGPDLHRRRQRHRPVPVDGPLGHDHDREVGRLMRSTITKRLLGLVSIALVLGFVWTTYAVFAKKFVSYDEVTLRSSKLGLQLPTRADVKFRGVIVGEVREVASTGNGAELTLGLYPDQRSQVPAEVTAQIVPKTLFGEKYVALDA